MQYISIKHEQFTFCQLSGDPYLFVHTASLILYSFLVVSSIAIGREGGVAPLIALACSDTEVTSNSSFVFHKSNYDLCSCWSLTWWLQHKWILDRFVLTWSYLFFLQGVYMITLVCYKFDNFLRHSLFLLILGFFFCRGMCLLIFIYIDKPSTIFQMSFCDFITFRSLIKTSIGTTMRA